eukprot:gb/GEZJ01004419.1/.p2 GENE.gb/GEZJ01004419.1/~~gb/GEZJ01004419.1/.p2  ORF type:complete len:100 (+),score=8.46 gb/GEZJ01004419.1/:1038-1337(+)
MHIECDNDIGKQYLVAQLGSSRVLRRYDFDREYVSCHLQTPGNTQKEQASFDSEHFKMFQKCADSNFQFCPNWSAKLYVNTKPKKQTQGFWRQNTIQLH